MAAEVDDEPPLSQNSELTSFRFFRQAGLDRRRPSKRQTTVRSFKIKTNWSKDGSSQAFTASSSQVSSSDLLITQEFCAIPPTPEQLHVDTSAASNSKSPEYEPPSISSSDTAHQPIIPQDSSPHYVAGSEHVMSDPVQLGPVTQSRSLEESPNSIVLESPKAQLQTDKATDVERTPSPSLQKLLIEKTPLSGPGVLKAKRGRKRRKDATESMADEEKDSLENEYQENNFVRLFNANHGRKSSMSEITDLDVILTAIEEEALDIRNEMQSSAGRQAIKEFFIQMRKSFSETIDVYKENSMLKSDLRKAKARINKLRKTLLSVQQKRSRMSASLEKEKTKQEENNDYRQKVLEDFSSFLVKLEALQDELGKDLSSKEASKLDYGSFNNLPSLLMKGHGLLTAANQLKYINDTLQKKQ